MMCIHKVVQQKLHLLQDLQYKSFYAKLVPTVSEDQIIGVRMPLLHKMARELIRCGLAEAFLRELPHTYYEENHLHAFIIGELKSYDKCIAELNRFLPYVDNWATCDSLRPKCFRGKSELLATEIKRWLDSNDTYSVRFGIEMLMVWYLDEMFEPEYMQRVASLTHENYYVKMMQAWYFSTALVKQFDAAIKYLRDRSLSPWLHNKIIQKATESRCITAKQKAYLRDLKR